MKKVFITIDTEEDNQWDFRHPSTTLNSRYLPRFQELCEKYKFIPTYLTTYGMANDPFFVEYIGGKFKLGLCEIGMHIHAWDTPPQYSNLNSYCEARPYIYEYPYEVMKLKIENITKKLNETFGTKVSITRSGRWATNKQYFDLLDLYGYKVDCSITPGISWKKVSGITGMGGSNYKKYKNQKFYLTNNLLELPTTIYKTRLFTIDKFTLKTLVKKVYNCVFGEQLWFRPSNTNENLKRLKRVIDMNLKDNNNDYIMFMIHSSELMPGCNPNFVTEDSVEKLYRELEISFQYLSQHYVGSSIEHYYDELNSKN